MKRRTLLAGTPAAAAGLILSTGVGAHQKTGMPLAAHYGELAGEALATCDWACHFDMQVLNGEVWFHNRDEPREAIAHHMRMIQRQVPLLPSGEMGASQRLRLLSEFSQWAFEVAP